MGETGKPGYQESPVGQLPQKEGLSRAAPLKHAPQGLVFTNVSLPNFKNGKLEMMSQGQATDNEIVCLSFPRPFSSNPFPNAPQPRAGNAGSNRKGRPEATAPAPPCSGVAVQCGLSVGCPSGVLGPKRVAGLGGASV